MVVTRQGTVRLRVTATSDVEAAVGCALKRVQMRMEVSLTLTLPLTPETGACEYQRDRGLMYNQGVGVMWQPCLCGRRRFSR